MKKALVPNFSRLTAITDMDTITEPMATKKLRTKKRKARRRAMAMALRR